MSFNVDKIVLTLEQICIFGFYWWFRWIVMQKLPCKRVGSPTLMEEAKTIVVENWEFKCSVMPEILSFSGIFGVSGIPSKNWYLEFLLLNILFQKGSCCLSKWWQNSSAYAFMEKSDFQNRNAQNNNSTGILGLPAIRNKEET